MPQLETTIRPSSERTTATDHSHTLYSRFWPQHPPEPLIKPRSNGNRPAVTRAHAVIGAGRPRATQNRVARLSRGCRPEMKIFLRRSGTAYIMCQASGGAAGQLSCSRELVLLGREGRITAHKVTATYCTRWRTLLLIRPTSSTRFFSSTCNIRVHYFILMSLRAWHVLERVFFSVLSFTY